METEQLPLAIDAGEPHPRDPSRRSAAEKIYESKVSRVLRLTLLAPGIVEAIGDDVGGAHAAVCSDVDGAADDVNRLLTTFAGLS